MVTWESVTTAIGLALGGDPPQGRADLLALWEQTDEHDHAQRCVMAHYLADLEEELDDEVAWDERALAELPHVGDDALAPVGIGSALGLAPSLHLNLGDGYLRQGRVADARDQLAAGLAVVDVLPDDGYGRMIRQGLAGLDERVTGAAQT
ncbi:hypothetical protein [Serinicoccus kebangsaanensis]|uniref:hypothetical protein n=1 Tax=Serinicoccus kebangsaanensis TaxID=2602069 RepID=UPI00124E123C|nr:hypothetical protein [Serinicoccus kebangsaanensis]